MPDDPGYDAFRLEQALDDLEQWGRQNPDRLAEVRPQLRDSIRRLTLLYTKTLLAENLKVEAA